MGRASGPRVCGTWCHFGRVGVSRLPTVSSIVSALISHVLSSNICSMPLLLLPAACASPISTDVPTAADLDPVHQPGLTLSCRDHHRPSSDWPARPPRDQAGPLSAVRRSSASCTPGLEGTPSRIPQTGVMGLLAVGEFDQLRHRHPPLATSGRWRPRPGRRWRRPSRSRMRAVTMRPQPSRVRSPRR